MSTCLRLGDEKIFFRYNPWAHGICWEQQEPYYWRRRSVSHFGIALHWASSSLGAGGHPHGEVRSGSPPYAAFHGVLLEPFRGDP